MSKALSCFMAALGIAGLLLLANATGASKANAARIGVEQAEPPPRPMSDPRTSMLCPNSWPAPDTTMRCWVFPVAMR